MSADDLDRTPEAEEAPQPPEVSPSRLPEFSHSANLLDPQTQAEQTDRSEPSDAIRAPGGARRALEPELSDLPGRVPTQVASSAGSRSAFADAIEAELLGGPRRFRRSEVSDAAGVTPEDTRTLWQAMGFANASDEARIFTDADVEALQQVAGMVREGKVNHEFARSLARAFGRSIDRLAMWQTQLLSDLIAGENEFALDSDTARSTAQLTVDMMDQLEPLLLYVWRRNVSQAVNRLIADSEPVSHVGVRRTVGFADLVSFTQLVRTLSERDLARLVSRFEALASDVVSEHGGAVVKTVGDEILFTHQQVSQAALIALDLVEAVNADPIIPHLRVGLSAGRVLARQGDVYGDTVNRASRLTAAAAPGGMLVDHEVAWGLATDGRFRCEELPPIELPGIGRLRPWTLERVDPTDTDPQ
ncbi:adenylate/guanylate cyclase domain-containing protein [Dermacoccaceae bacterium W4C1]